jgi:hypothetical protein
MPALKNASSVRHRDEWQSPTTAECGVRDLTFAKTRASLEAAADGTSGVIKRLCEKPLRLKWQVNV